MVHHRPTCALVASRRQRFFPLTSGKFVQVYRSAGVFRLVCRDATRGQGLGREDVTVMESQLSDSCPVLLYTHDAGPVSRLSSPI